MGQEEEVTDSSPELVVNEAKRRLQSLVRDGKVIVLELRPVDLTE